MQSSAQTTKTTTLVLTEEEAEWLHRNMQNPLHGQHVILEDDNDAVMRMKFFNATQPS
jgi:hypothetical protein